MIPPIIALALITGFSTLPIRIVISRRPFRVRNLWNQIILSVTIGALLWIGLIFLTKSTTTPSGQLWGDIICGILIFLCAFWCNYWIGNFAGGFRVQMQLSIANQKQPITLDEWMNIFGGLGMEVFLRDRIQSILLPWKTVTLDDGNLRLRPGWGTFFGKLMAFLKRIMPKARGD